MLKPAILYKDELEKLFAEVMYNDDYFLYMGYVHGHELPKIEPVDNVYQWAVVSPERWESCGIKHIPEKVIGWFAYRIDSHNDCVYNFGLYSFDKGNVLIGKDVFTKMKELVQSHRRIEWRCIGGNPAAKSYDRFCKKYKGKKNTLHKVTKDSSGIYRDEYIYEIVKPANNSFEQVAWERDVALDQLKQISKGLGAKMDDVITAIDYYESNIITE